MPLEYEDTITTDVNKRLEELFERQDDFPGIPDAYLYSERNHGHFNQLAELLDSVGAHFSDSKIEQYQTEIKNLKVMFQKQKVLSMFLRLLESLGRFILNHQLNTDREAIELVKKCFEDTRLTAGTPSITLSVQKKILYHDIMEYKKLKEIRSGIDRSDKDSGKGKKKNIKNEKVVEQVDRVSFEPPTKHTRDIEEMTPHEAFAIALSQIRQMIQTEFSALRAELKMWRKGQ